MPTHKIIRSGAGAYVNTPNGGPTFNTIRVDPSTDTLRFGTGSSGTTEKQAADTTSLQTLAGKTIASFDGIVKVQPVTGTKTWISGTAYAAFTTQVPALSGCGGIVMWSVMAINATDIQVDTFHTTYAVVNKAGTLTLTHTYVSAEEAKAVSAGTLTFSATATDSTGGLATFNITGTSSITPTTLVLNFTVFPIIGAVIIL